MRDNKRKRTARKARSIELVLGGGGIKGFGHIGLLKALEERKVALSKITGVSIGSIIATLYTNGYTPEQINQIFISELESLEPDGLKEKLRLPSARRLIKGGFVDLRDLFKKLVEKYKLKPQPNLRILAYDVVAGQPVIFEGSAYNLSEAIAASCAIPFIMRPVWHGRHSQPNEDAGHAETACCEGGHGGSILVDGGMHHPNPGEFASGSAIISKLGFASKLPTEQLPWLDLGLHVVEMFWSVALGWYYPDPENHLVIATGSPDVACLTFGISRQKSKEMVDYGYQQSCLMLDDGIKGDKVPVRKRRS